MFTPFTFKKEDSFTFKKDYSFNERFEESNRVLIKYPDRKPIICEKSNKANTTNLPDIDKKKYLVPDDLNVGQFIYVIRNRMKLKPEEAIFLFINNKFMPVTAIIGQIYSQEKDNDGFLYIEYDKENVFG
jgi:GABA(A) receptor-associated protein